MMLTEDEVNDILSELQVYPGGHDHWTFHYDAADDELRVEWTAPDSRNDEYFEGENPPEKAPELLQGSIPGPPLGFKRPSEVVQYGMQLAAITAVHEILEWARFRGSPPIDPHGIEQPNVTLPVVSVEDL
jgi:hypothetical protein